MAVRVDLSKCTGIGLCEVTAPTVFQIGDDGQSRVIEDNLDAEERAAVEEAISNCPTRALSMDAS